MVPPASKRRKIEHEQLEENQEEASFASEDDHGSYEGESASLGEDVDDDDQMRPSDPQDSTDDGEDNIHDDYDDDDGPSGGDQASQTSQNGRARQIASSSSGKSGNRSTKIAHVGVNPYANGAFKSNIFALQTQELLNQIRPKHGRRETAAERALHALKKTIEQMPSRGPHTLVEAERNLIKEKIAIPFPDPPPPRDAKYKFAFTKPTNINVAGSFALKTASRMQHELEVDMVVCMPASIFQEKDYLNYRYFYKRAYYLACIASGLVAAHKSEYTFRFKLKHDDPLKPILVVGPAEKDADIDQAPHSKWCINVMPCIAEDQFASHKLMPHNNCIRGQATDADDSSTLNRHATPVYNSAIRADMLITPYLKLLHGAAKRCDAFVDACLLGNTWLQQRGFASSIHSGGFGPFEWQALVALCLHSGGPGGKPLLGMGYSSYQLFKAALQLIATKNFSKQPFVVGKSSETLAKGDNIPIVWDAERLHNVFYKVQPSAYQLLRYEARLTSGALSDQLHDGFDATFILRVQEALYRFDQVVTIPLHDLEKQVKPADAQRHAKNVFQILHRGLGDRVRQIAITLPATEPWKIGSSPKNMGNSGEMRIGLIINPDSAQRMVDHGPTAENKAEAASFREFWGSRAELRRFKDGSILESLVWNSPLDGEQSVIQQIVRHVLNRHAGLVTTDNLTFIGESFSKLVRGSAERSAFDAMLARYNQLENDIRDLRELPLTIRSIMPADPQLRCASLRPPANSRSVQRSKPADVIIQFEGSGRWPDDLVAIQRTKIAFLLKIHDMLRDSVDSIDARIGLENEGQEVLNQAYLDVTYDAEATFRLRIFHDREQTLHERRLKDKTVDPKSKEISASGLATYKRGYTKTPALTQAISRLCTRYPALSGSIRLAKRWFAAHLLANHVPEEVVELLVVRTFMQSWPWETPSSIQTGFLRTLFWISRWDWRAEPLVVDLSASGEMKPTDMQAINTNFEAWRRLDPGMNRVALFVASNLDHDGNTWTDGQPAKVVAGRMTALAKAACAEVVDQQLELDPLSLFSSPLEDFDFVLHMNPTFTTGKHAKSGSNGTTTYKNLDLALVNDITMIGFDPVQDVVDELSRLYGSALLLFYGGSERAVIAGLWSPLTARRSWKVSLAYSTIPRSCPDDGDHANDVQVDANKSAMLAEIGKVAGDLVEKIEVFRK